MPYKCIKSSNLSSMKILKIRDITKNSYLSQLSYFALANIRLHRYDLFFRFISLLGDTNVNPGPTTVNNNKISLNTLPFYKCTEPTMLPECDSSDYNKEHESKWSTNPNEIFARIGTCMFYI